MRIGGIPLFTPLGGGSGSATVVQFTAYTPTLTGFGTPSNVNAAYFEVSKCLIIRVNFTSGTSTAVEARCSLPAGYTSVSSSVLPAIALCGYGCWDFNSANIPTILIENNVSYVTFGAQGAGYAGLTKLNGDGYLSNGQGLTFYAIIPVA